MILFLHDEKHNQLLGKDNLGEISESEKTLVERVISFLEFHNILDRYKTLSLMEDNESPVIVDDEEDVVLEEELLIERGQI